MNALETSSRITTAEVKDTLRKESCHSFATSLIFNFERPFSPG